MRLIRVRAAGLNWEIAAYHAAFMTGTAAIVARGISRGIEKAVTVLMPVLAALLIALAAYSALEGDLGAALDFLFRLNTQKLTLNAALEALGLGFFSIGVGMGLMITYAAYSGREIRLTGVVLISVLADTGISLLAGIAIFPIVFAHGLDTASGPGLVFITLPIAFAGMPLGTVAAIAFFSLLFVAALSSAISMLEVVVAMLVQRLGWTRLTISSLVATSCFLAGIATVLSFNVLAHWHPLAGLESFAGATLFDLLDHATSSLMQMLPLGGLALSLFAGWAIPEGVIGSALLLPRAPALALRFTLHYIAPCGIILTMLASFF